MYIVDIVTRVNKLLANNSSYRVKYFDSLDFYIELAVDKINDELKTTFQTPAELYESYRLIYDAIAAGMFLGVFNTAPISIANGQVYYNALTDLAYKYDGSTWVETPVTSPLVVGTSMDITKFNYNVIPDRYIRQILIYLAASFYLEEEDELENQYLSYKQRAELALLNWRKKDYSMYHTADSIKVITDTLDGTTSTVVISGSTGVDMSLVMAILGSSIIKDSVEELEELDVADGTVGLVYDTNTNRWVSYTYNSASNLWIIGETVSMLDLLSRAKVTVSDDQPEDLRQGDIWFDEQ